MRRFSGMIRIHSVVACLLAGIAALVVIGIAALGAPPAGAAPVSSDKGTDPSQAQPAVDCTFTTQLPLNRNTVSNYFDGISVLAANDIWAVGHRLTGVVFMTLVEHWNGTTWSVVSSPSPGTSENRLLAVDARAANDVWAAGFYITANVRQSLIEHWDGSTWSVVPVVNPGLTLNNLGGITAIAANDAWAVGYYKDVTNVTRTLIEHWNGTLWTVTSSPNQGSGDNTLGAVYAQSANDVWAVGNYSQGSATKTLAEHWNGTAWSIVSSPSPGTSLNLLSSVSAVSANDVWAVGFFSNGGDYQTLTEHWNGSAWSQVASPIVGAGNNELFGVKAVSANDVWAVGRYAIQHTLVEHWNGSAWSIVASPSENSTPNILTSIDAVSSGDVWAGGYYSTGGETSQAFAQHWNGGAWSIVAAANLGSFDNYLYGVTAPQYAPNDVWAVGYYVDYHNVQQALTEHWNGTEWRMIPGYVEGGIEKNKLFGVSAVNSDDVWAVGVYSFTRSSTNLPIAEHWNGTAWSGVLLPYNGSQDNFLTAVSARTTSDVWAAGYYHTTAHGNQTLVEHWNGAAWSIVPSPNVGSLENQLTGIVSLSANDVWAVGYYKDSASNTNHTLTMHWNGSSWIVVSSPTTGSAGNYLYGVSAVSANDVWAVGSFAGGTEGAGDQTLVQHWNGIAWSIVASPVPGSAGNSLSSVAAVSANDVWAVGSTNNGSGDQPLVEHWNGTAWSVVASPAEGTEGSRFTGVTAVSGDDIWAVGRHTFLTYEQTLAEHYYCVQACTLQFEDAPSGSTYYPYVRCMACQGIINGYACGSVGEPCNGNNDPYFRPNSNVTRGQIAKIVALASDNHTPVSGQSFEDVPVGSTFYTYAEQLYALGVMSGYPCGGPGEPCGGGYLPYFRPNNSATRAQLTKIAANAAELRDTPSGQQFEDVAPGSTFYTFTYELVSRSIMSGYACGGPGEPCVGPGNLPYFRPNNNVTRGQSSKIVGNTFFPDCSIALRD